MKPIQVLLIGALCLGMIPSAISCGPATARAPRKSCKALKKCERTTFDYAFSSMQDCVAEANDWMDEVEAVTGKSCAKAIAKAQICGSKVLLKDCSASEAAVRNACQDEENDMRNECGVYDEYYFDDLYY